MILLGVRVKKNKNWSAQSFINTMDVGLNFNIGNYGIKLFSDQINAPQEDMCFSINMITRSVIKMNHLISSKDLFESIPD